MFFNSLFFLTNISFTSTFVINVVVRIWKLVESFCFHLRWKAHWTLLTSFVRCSQKLGTISNLIVCKVEIKVSFFRSNSAFETKNSVSQFECCGYQLIAKEVLHATIKSHLPGSFLSIFLNIMRIVTPTMATMMNNFFQVTRMFACFSVKKTKRQFLIQSPILNSFYFLTTFESDSRVPFSHNWERHSYASFNLVGTYLAKPVFPDRYASMHKTLNSAAT